MKKEELEKELMEIWFLLLEAKRSYYYAKYLFSPETSNERTYINGSVDLQVIRTVMWRYSIIELSKLFKDGKNEKHSIKKLMQSFQPGHKYAKAKLDNSIIANWEDELTNRKILLYEITYMRDKAFAHSDIGYRESVKYNTILAEVEDLFTICEKFITDVFQNVLNKTPFHDANHSTNNLSEVVKVLVRNEDEKDKKNIEKYKEFTKM